MRENRFFIKSTELEGLTRVGEAGSAAAAGYERIIDEIERLCGREAASLFAEPVYPRDGAGASNAVSWYGRREGAPVELQNYDEIARRPVLERLQQRVEALRPALDDPRLGPIVRAWLYVASTHDILAVGGEPTLVNWGYVPANIGSSPEALRAHQQNTLGRFVPMTDLEPSESHNQGEAGPAPAAEQRPPLRSGSLNPATSGRPAPIPAWRAPAIASAIAAAILIALLLPGVLVYPASSDNAARDAFELDRLKASNKSLEAQLGALDASGKDKVCRMPGETAPVPALRNDGDPSQPPRMELVPKSPEKAALPPGEGGSKTVADLLDKATVLVFGLGPKDSGSQGTGFFVNNRQIVTNRHVVENIEPQLIFVASQALGGIRHARIAAETSSPPVSDDLRPDFALLEIDAPEGLSPLKLGPSPPKLSTAYVAGFPGFLTRRDAAFDDFIQQLAKSLDGGKVDEAKLRQEAHVPGADLRYGRVNNVMESGSQRLPIVIHDMQLAPGNSGGPLVDACGRVGGVNTLLFSTDADKKSSLTQQGNVALDVSLLRKFLGDQHAAFQSDDKSCDAAAPTTPPTISPPNERR